LKAIKKPFKKKETENPHLIVRFILGYLEPQTRPTRKRDCDAHSAAMEATQQTTRKECKADIYTAAKYQSSQMNVGEAQPLTADFHHRKYTPCKKAKNPALSNPHSDRPISAQKSP